MSSIRVMSSLTGDEATAGASAKVPKSSRLPATHNGPSTDVHGTPLHVAKLSWTALTSPSFHSGRPCWTDTLVKGTRTTLG